MSAAAPVVAGRGIGEHGADASRPDAGLAATRTFHGLDALRGLAAVVVVLFHGSFVYGIDRPPLGYLAVDLFFAMSGFIVAHRYDGDLAAGMTVAAFARLRLARLYPLYLLGTLVGVLPSAALLLAQGASAHHLAMLSALPPALLMLPSQAAWPRIELLYPLNGVSWSLALEVMVNLAYAALFRRLSVPALAAVAAAGLAGLCACAFAYGTVEVGYQWLHAAGGLARVAFAFPLGVLLRRLLPRDPGRTRLPRVAWPLPILAALVLFTTPPLVAGEGARALWALAGCTVAVPLILVAAISGEPPRRLHRGCALAGAYSYVVYSLHMPLIGLLLRVETQLHLDLTRQTAGEAAAFTAALVAASLAAHHLYDKPLRRLLARRGRPARREEPVPRSGILSQPS